MDGSPDDEPGGQGQSQGAGSRRKLLATLIGGGLGAAACVPVIGSGLFAPDDEEPPPPRSRADGTPRKAATTPADGGTYLDRDDSYTAGAGGQAGSATPDPAEPFSGPAAAAAATKVTVPTILDTSAPELHLLRRFTFGPNPRTVAEVRQVGIDRWLAAQLAPDTVPDADGDAAWRVFPLAAMSPAQVRGAVREYSWDAMLAHAQATLARQLWSRRQVNEVVVDFWANHLNVTLPSDGAWDVGPSYHNTVIRAHALGSFRAMLTAAMRHPAMLRYLSNDESRRESVNENLGRELLELHTVGVGAGYTEDDVRNSAFLLTGRTTTKEGEFKYDPKWHWTGPVTVLGFSDANASGPGGLALGDRYLAHLATHPATARQIARKLAVRFVADDPPKALVDRLAAVYLESDTEIVPVLKALLSSREFWASVGQKTRRPLENVVASARALDVRPGSDTAKSVADLYWSLDEVGQRPLGWAPPNGYPDVAGAWASAGSMLQVWNRHRGLVQGWWKGLTYTKPEDLVPTRGSAGSYVDALCERLLLQRMSPAHRQALVAFFDGATAAQAAPHLVPVVLDSPYFALR